MGGAVDSGLGAGGARHQRARSAWRRWHRGSLIGVVTLVCTLCASSAEAQADSESRRLAAATARLVPYDVHDRSLQALRDLAALESSDQRRVALTARFLRAAASVDLATYARIQHDRDTWEALARVWGVPSQALVATLVRACRSIRTGVFGAMLAPYADVASCLTDDPDPACAARLRRAARSPSGAATAARLILLPRELRAVEEARNAEGRQSLAPLLSLLPESPTCSEGDCQGPSLDERTEAARWAFETIVEDFRALATAAAGGDPLAVISSSRIDGIVERLGWLALGRPLRQRDFPQSQLPDENGPASVLPLELLIVDGRGATVALSPMVFVGRDGSVRPDQTIGLPMPGTPFLPRPFRFRPAIRSVPRAEEVLRDLRSQVDALIEARGSRGPRWLSPDRRPLGLVLDRDLMMADVARFVFSARRAGYEHFEIVGRRPDGSLATLPVRIVPESEAPPVSQAPRVTVGPREVRMQRPGGVVTMLDRHPDAVARAVAESVEADEAFVVQSTQPWLRLGVVLPFIDAIVSTLPDSRRSSMMVLIP